MPEAVSVSLARRLTSDDSLLDGVERCWFDVSSAGGAVGFPMHPVRRDEVASAARRLAHDVATGSTEVFVAERGDDVVGWVSLRLNSAAVATHWATVERLQCRPDARGLGIGTRLMAALTKHAAGTGLEHLRLALRAGEGLEAFYGRLGWVEIGRHPGALRLSEGDDRDEVSMLLDLAGRGRVHTT